MMDSATPPCGCAQNDGIAGFGLKFLQVMASKELVGIQVSNGNEGSLQSCSCGADSTHLTLPVCEQHEDRGGMCVIAHFPSSLQSVIKFFAHLSSIHSQNDHPVTDT